MSPLASWWIVLCCVGVVVFAIWLAESHRPVCQVCHGPIVEDDDWASPDFCSQACAAAHARESIHG